MRTCVLWQHTLGVADTVNRKRHAEEGRVLERTPAQVQGALTTRYADRVKPPRDDQVGLAR